MKVKTVLRAAPLLIFATISGFALWGLDPDRDPREIPSVLIDKPAPDFELPPIEGLDTKGLKTADLPSDRPTLVNVFASWCVPCRAEHAVLTRMAEERGVRLLGINYKDKPENVRKWLGELGNPYEQIGADEGGRVGLEWGIFGVPETFVISPEGRVLHRVVGPVQTAKTVEQIMAILTESRLDRPADGRTEGQS